MGGNIVAQRENQIPVDNIQRRDSRVFVNFDQGQYHEPMLYLDILVDITLQFIRAEQSEEYKIFGASPRIASDTLTVNASACEFMELILK